MAKPVKKTASRKVSKNSKVAPTPIINAGSNLTGKKSTMILQLLRRQQGATIAELIAATEWQQHSVRGFMSGTVKKKYGLRLTSEIVEGTRHYRVPA